ncbi:UPF0603 protein Os05g0401100, chloroplastic [Dendrobium catenatum]|uniref:UPF0603 protein n=1 Tax=Dendrobium catenatum TaxID=906689 RepID=A0A2I0WY43_9ASPA|nr:UPF0603 protein Os05g0401100, chloroplastic [Dendrobium catenatum]PKU80567.1 UPF0603 protein [Dendrobium catenatum]
METILFSPSSNPILNPKSIFSKTPSLPRLNKPIISSVLKKPIQSTHASLSSQNKDWLSSLHHGLAAAAISIAINFCPLPTATGPAIASEFDVLNEGPPTESYVVDDAGVLSRVTKSDLKRMFSDLESRKNLHVNFITVRKLTSKADAFEYADSVLEKWYPTVEEGNNKGIVVLVTTQKEGAITGGPAFIEAVGEKVLDATVSENLPVLATEEKYNEAMISTANRLVAAIDGLPDPGGPKFKDNKRESNFKSKEETEEKRGQFSLVVGGLLVIAFVVPMAQYYAYVSRK